MNDQKKYFSITRRGGIHGKMTLGLGVFGAFLIGGFFLLPPAQDVLRAGHAAAVESLNDLASSPTSTPTISEVSVLPVAEGTDAASESLWGDVSRASSGEESSIVPENNGIAAVPVSASSDPLSANGEISEISVPDPVPEVLPDVPKQEKSSAKICEYPSSSRDIIKDGIIFNEIAWMGSPPVAGEGQEAAAGREWIELKNISPREISLAGWRIVDGRGNIHIEFGSGDRIAAGGLYLLSRGGEAVGGVASDKSYTGILSNSGDGLAILDGSCAVSDRLDAGKEWPGGSNKTKQTLERTSDLGWQTSADPGGTPRSQNSRGQPAADVAGNATTTYAVSVMVAGDGGGKVVMPSGNGFCLENCTNSYRAGTSLTFSAIPGREDDFTGWTGACSGTGDCSFIVNGSTSVGAVFHVLADRGSAVDDVSELSSAVSDLSAAADASSGGMVATDTAPSASKDIFIVAVQIAGASSGDDFVKIYNASSEAIDIGGWHLRKKASTGGASSLREFPQGTEVSPGSSFTWASSADGFAASIGADVSSTGSLAANNSIALFDASGTEVDALAWGNGTDQYGDGSPYPENPGPGEVLARKMEQGTFVDGEDNASDFFVQNTTSS